MTQSTAVRVGALRRVGVVVGAAAADALWLGGVGRPGVGRRRSIRGPPVADARGRPATVAVKPVAPVNDDAVGGAVRAQHAVAVAVGDVDVVSSRPAISDRGALPVDELVVATAALEPIAPGASMDAVMVVAAADVVVAGTAVDVVVAAPAVDVVVAAPAVNEVVAVGAPDAGAGAPAGADLIVAGAAHEPLAGARARS